MVRTRHLNLAEPFPPLGTFDLVLLRNVLIYFDQPTRHGILRRMHQHVASDGYLLLGSSETTLDLPADLTAMWQREQIGRVQAHRPTRVSIPRPAPAPFTSISDTLTGARP
jgi:chemotaxis protein methyltransferase CheR